jgi:hypothetical protein
MTITIKLSLTKHSFEWATAIIRAEVTDHTGTSNYYTVTDRLSYTYQWKAGIFPRTSTFPTMGNLGKLRVDALNAAVLSFYVNYIRNNSKYKHWDNNTAFLALCDELAKCTYSFATELKDEVLDQFFKDFV